MTSKWHVHLTMDGRISMAGLSGELVLACLLGAWGDGSWKEGAGAGRVVGGGPPRQ